MATLTAALADASPRLNPRPTPLHSILVYVFVYGFWLVLVGRAFLAPGILAWSVGIVYLVYDTALLLFTASRTLPLRQGGRAEERPAIGSDSSLGVIVAAYNEAPVLAKTIESLAAQDAPPEVIILADDGSTDGSAQVLAERYRLVPPEFGRISEPSPVVPALRWLRLPRGGKAVALNESLRHLGTGIVLTVDADTLLEPGAIAAIRRAFAADPDLVVGGGVLSPRCDRSLSGRLFQGFQTFEYLRNFIARFAWSRIDSLLLISGAFAAFRREALMTVGGFDPAFLVEDYELIHRLHRYAAEHGLSWRVRIIGAALARTDAPARILPFLRQRRRWFAGFLQTQYWNRDMTGSARYGALGLLMMPVKAIDTFQPVYGLTAFLLLPGFLLSGRADIVGAALLITLGKIAIDLGFHLWSILLYRRWTGDCAGARLWLALLVAVIEPFSFQVLRHIGAVWGWISFLTGRQSWGRQERSGALVPAE